MDITHLHLVTGRLAPSSAPEVHEAERALGTPLPAGYAAFVQRYGQGLVGDFVRVYIPNDVVTMTEEWRDRVTAYWFWDTAGTGVTPEQLQSDGVVFADTVNGDEVCFVAGNPDRCYILPRDSDEAVAVAGDLSEVLSWLLESGQLIRPAPLPTFESWVDRARLRYEAEGEAAFAGVRDGLLALRAHDLVKQDGKRLVLLIPSAGTRIEVSGHYMVRVLVSHDASHPQDVIAQVVGILEANGLHRTTA